jgi:O-antigen/teichoic acid export membrane protein
MSKPDGGADSPQDLRRKTARGALTSIGGQAASFALRIGSMVAMARLVTPEHFGLVGMVTAFVGLLSLFRDAGLSSATVQRETVSDDLVSALFWINLAIGALLAVLTVAAAPLLAAFFGEPRLFWITIGLSVSFIFNGALAQHRALLQRRMRFGALAVIDIVAVVSSICVGVAMALAGMGYWALVGMAVSQPVVSAIGMWLTAGWTPGRPRRVDGLVAMLKYGGVMTMNGLVVYVAYNADKILIGRFLGAEALGIYGRAYQLINMASENLHTTLGWVMFPALARVQNDPVRQRSYFLKGYGLFLSVVVPLTMACALLADDIVRVFLGPQWTNAVPIFRLLSPTVLAFAIINPMGHLMMASGHAMRSLKVGLLIAPVVIAGYVLGLPYGAAGVACGFSAAMLALVVPVVMWAKRDTLITSGDLLRTALPPFVAAGAGALMASFVEMHLRAAPGLGHLVIVAAVLFATHLLVLVLYPGQKQLYLDLFAALSHRRQPSAPVPAEVRT